MSFLVGYIDLLKGDVNHVPGELGGESFWTVFRDADIKGMKCELIDR